MHHCLGLNRTKIEFFFYIYSDRINLFSIFTVDKSNSVIYPNDLKPVLMLKVCFTV